MPENTPENSNWKEIRSKIEAWAAKSKASPELIAPIFAHTPIRPVEAKPESLLIVFDSFQSPSEYSYLMTLIKKNGKYLATLHMYLIEKGKEVPLTIDQKTFEKNDYKNICDSTSIPYKLFRLKGVRKKVMTFKQTKMTERKFEKEIETWRGKQT